MAALLDIVTKDSTDRSVVIRIVDSSDGTPETSVVYNTSGIDLWYRREGAAKTSITEATLAALTTAHTDGGFLHIGDGEYRLDLPDAAFATGANYVDVGGTVTDMVVIGGRVRLTDHDLETALNDLSAAEVNAEVDTALSDYDGPTNTEMAAAFAALNDLSAADVNAEVDTALADYDGPTNAEMVAALGALNDLSAAQVNAEVDTALADYDGPTNAEMAAAIDALNNLSAAEVNTELLDVLTVDTHAELGQGTPPATAAILTMIQYIYKAWRNKKTQTSSAFNLFADDGSTVDQKATISDDGTTGTFGEIGTGP